MAKKVKHYRTPMIRTDSMDMDPYTKYQDLKWKYVEKSEDYESNQNRYKYDAITHKVVAKPAQDATRNGFRIVIKDNPDLQDKYQAKLDSLKLQSGLTDQIIYQREGGDGYLSIGVMEKKATGLNTPINPQNIADVAFVHAFSQEQVEQYLTNDDPTSIDYGKTQAIVINPRQAGTSVDKNGNIKDNNGKPNKVVLDSSRYCHITLDKFADDYTGTSIISRCSEQLKAMSIALDTVGKILREYTFKVVHSDTFMNKSDDEFEKAKDELSQRLNTEATVFIGSEDSIDKMSTQTNGIDTLLDFAWQNLSAACDIPKSVLTGEQAGTLAGASQDVINYYDSIKAMQDQLLKPEIEKIVKLLMYSTNVAGGYLDPDSVDWHIEFNRLWTPDDKTMAEINLTNTQAAVARVGAGMQAPDEAMESLNGQANNQIQSTQSLGTDSVDNLPYTKEQVEQYERDLEAAHNGTA